MLHTLVGVDAAYLSDEPETAGRKLFVVDVIARHGVGVHQVRATLKQTKE